MWGRLLVVVAIAACSAPAPVAPKPPPLAIATDRGVVVGRAHGGVREFLGIPYAAPPVGARRWRAPEPAAAWSSPRDATARAKACPQPDMGFQRDTSEDCLTLNVWVPEGDHLPVLVWIHGGAFFQGSGADDLYDGARLARRAHAIVVTFDYRLGALGFLSHPALAREQGRTVAPSVALLDQRAAFAWVRRNIAAFGGDPAAVTLFGESAGAWAECMHLVSPGSAGLFAKVILQSGVCGDAMYFTGEAANAQGEALAAALGCTGSDADVLACMRDKPVDQILAALPFKRGLVLPPGVWWGPVIDGVELPKMPFEAMRANAFAHVPVMLGWAREEGTLHTVGFKEVKTDELADFVRASFPARAVEPVLAHYADRDPKAALDAVIRDGVFGCHVRRVARTLAAHGVPVYLYRWMHALDLPTAHALGPTHSVDLWFVFGTASAGVGTSAREQPLVELVQGAWGAFARTSDPSTPELAWPRYRAETEDHVELELPAPVVPLDDCRFWDEVLGYAADVGR